LLQSDLTSALNACVHDADLDPATPFVTGIQIGDLTAWNEIPGIPNADPPITRTSLVYAASLAKQVAGACFAIVVRDCAVHLDDNLARWFPELPGWAADIRLHHVVSHTAGFPTDVELLQRMKERGVAHRTTPGILAALQGYDELAEIPGTRYSYSDIGYVCLARIVEIACDEPLESFSKRHIFTPIGMDSTTFWRGPDSFPDGARPVEPEPILGLPYSLGDGGLWTTADDFLRWCDAMNRDQLGISELVQRTSALNDGTPLDYGWGIRRIELNGVIGWSHGGSWPGIFSKAVRFPELRASFVAFTLDTDIDPILRLTNHVQDVLTDSTLGL
jgi:CubicO group peptidase (beta-lactamase class C family)